MPGIICWAAVAMAVRGHKLLTAMPNRRNSAAWPSVHDAEHQVEALHRRVRGNAPPIGAFSSN
jgi:hypothetical protein